MMDAEHNQNNRELNISRHLTTTEKQSVIDLFKHNLSINKIANEHCITKRRVREIIREYKKGRTSTFTKVQEEELVKLFNQGKTSVKLLRPFFPLISCYAIRNKIKLFIRWGLIQPSGSFTSNSNSSCIRVRKEEIQKMDGNICLINDDVNNSNHKPDFCEFNEFVDVEMH